MVLIDDTDRENEADLICSAQHATGSIINFFVTQARGLVCVSMEAERQAQLRLPQMVQQNEDHWGTRFTVSVDHQSCLTGISAWERAKTITALADLQSVHTDFRRPGHVFPLEAHPGGVIYRLGHTESSIDLLKLAGLYPAAVLCEILQEDGHMLRGAAVSAFCTQHNLDCVTVQEILEHRLETEDLLIEVRRGAIAHGVEIVYRDCSGNLDHTLYLHLDHTLYLRNNWQKELAQDQLPLFLLQGQSHPPVEVLFREHPVIAKMGDTPQALCGSKDELWTKNLQRCFLQKIHEQRTISNQNE